MGIGTLTLCSASAGSGKTYKLTGTYLQNIFRSRYNYRRILAVTFTNKATAEMKFRIIDNLDKLANGKESPYMADLVNSLGKSEDWIRKEAGEILDSILHDYTRFSVSTIDGFFQKILRAFAREAGLHTGYSVELDHTPILSSAVDEMISKAVSDEQLGKWLLNYAMSKIDDEKSWNIRDEIISLAEELFKEKFRILSTDERAKLGDKQFLVDYMNRLRSLCSAYEKTLKDHGTNALRIFSEYNLSDDLFYRKSQGIPRFIRLLSQGVFTIPNSYVVEVMNDPPRWTTGAVPPVLQSALEAGLASEVQDAIRFIGNKSREYKSAGVILSNIYALGILSDVLRNVHEITSSGNSFLLSDAGEVINLIIKGDQTPFIYEKTGNRFDNFMIDEFQDTSTIQWNNFRPLIENSMAEGFDNLIVGDVKQSIYRWRNSDWQILGTELTRQVDGERILSDQLTTNYRSRKNIIDFNNALFSRIPELIDRQLDDESLPVRFSELYDGAVQEDPGKSPGGYIRIEFPEDTEEISWQEQVLEKLPSMAEMLQERGYSASDIGIIVRDGNEGSRVLKKFIDYSSSCSAEKKARYNYNIVSNDSLLLSNSPVINFIISVLKSVNEPEDMICRAMMVRLYLLSKGEAHADMVALDKDKLAESSESVFPSGYEEFLKNTDRMPLFEAVEGIIRFFGLGNQTWNVAYLNTFQDHVAAFSLNKSADSRSFLEWWQTSGIRKSVVLPGNQDAMRVLTIHKSKGLEFRVVILPFLSWELDHLPSKQPILWVKPDLPPFNTLGIVPVRYGKDLSDTIFEDDYKKEKYSVYLDNINLLYVAMTRAKDVIYGFSPGHKRPDSSIASMLRTALSMETGNEARSSLILEKHFDTENRMFEFGVLPENDQELVSSNVMTSEIYPVTDTSDSLRLKFSFENYFGEENDGFVRKINYGRLMHEVFAGIRVPGDVHSAVNRLVIEGMLAGEEAENLEMRINALLADPQVAEWFSPGREVWREAEILLPSGSRQRPDRIIMHNGKAVIVDFKFGAENPNHMKQVVSYSRLLNEMGYDNVESFLWYVDSNKILQA